MLKEVHVKVVLALHGLLNAQLEDVGEVAGGIEPQINHGVPDAESKITTFKIQHLHHVKLANDLYSCHFQMHAILQTKRQITSVQQKDETDWDKKN